MILKVMKFHLINQTSSLLNKTKISISNDDTRHYLNGIYLHLTESQNRTYLTGVATDSHRLSSSSIEIDQENFSFNNFT